MTRPERPWIPALPLPGVAASRRLRVLMAPVAANGDTAHGLDPLVRLRELECATPRALP